MDPKTLRLAMAASAMYAHADLTRESDLDPKPPKRISPTAHLRNDAERLSQAERKRQRRKEKRRQQLTDALTQ